MPGHNDRLLFRIIFPIHSVRLHGVHAGEARRRRNGPIPNESLPAPKFSDIAAQASQLLKRKEISMTSSNTPQNNEALFATAIAKTRAPLLEGHHLPGDFYTSPNTYKLEQERIFQTDWLDSYVRNNTKEATYVSYELAYRVHLLALFGDKDIRTISRSEVKRFIYDKLNAGLARNTVRGYLAPLREMFNHALEDGHLDRNPCQGVMRNIRAEHGERKGRINFLTRDEVGDLLEAFKEYFPAHSPFVLLLVRTGLRLGEAVALEWGDIDFRDRFIEVRRTYSKGKLQTPKSGKWRRVDMSLQLTERLEALQRERRKETLQHGWRGMPEWVFTSTNGAMMDSDNFRRRVWLRLLTKAGFRHMQMKDLRHTFASLLIQQGESLAYVKEQMGHHSIQVTVDIYGHLVPGGNKAAVDKLDDSPATIRNQS